MPCRWRRRRTLAVARQTVGFSFESCGSFLQTVEARGSCRQLFQLHLDGLQPFLPSHSPKRRADGNRSRWTARMVRPGRVHKDRPAKAGFRKQSPSARPRYSAANASIAFFMATDECLDAARPGGTISAYCQGRHLFRNAHGSREGKGVVDFSRRDKDRLNSRNVAIQAAISSKTTSDVLTRGNRR